MATQIVNTHEAKSRLSELIREVEAGGDVIVARNGHPVAKLIPWPPTRSERLAGAWSGAVSLHSSDEPSDIVGSDEEVNELFEESLRQEL